MADVKISEMTSAVSVDETDNLELSQENSGVFTSVKASILAIANKIASGINFTSALETTNKTLTGAINEAAQSGGSGGHTILNDGGSALSQEDNLQFVGVYSEDDSVSEKTVVNIVREMTQAQYDLLSADEKKGIIRITDKNYVCEASEVKFGSGNVEAEVEKKVDWVSNSVLGAKNLNKYPYYDTTKTISDLVYTDNGDGTITANGSNNTASNANFNFHQRNQSLKNLILPNGKYILTGCPSGGNNTYYIRLETTISGVRTVLGFDYGDGVEVELTGDDYAPTGFTQIGLVAVVTANLTVNNIVFKPMIRKKEDTDTTYRPYAMTNKELTDIVKNTPSTAGTYTLQLVVDASGNETYSWV